MKLTGAPARKFLAKPDRSVVAVLLYGPNRGLSSEAAQRLVQGALGDGKDAFGLTRLADEDIRKDKARLSDALAAQSLLGGASCVWLKIENESASDTIIAALKEIEAGAERAFWVVEAGEIAAKGRLVKAFEDAGRAAAIAFYEETDAERAAAMKAMIQDRAIALEGDALDVFVSEAPHDRLLARNEIEKLAAYGHGLGRPISLDEVFALSIASAAPELDEAVIAACGGKRAQALQLLDQSDAAAVSALRALQRRIARLMEARLLVEGGVAVSEAGDRLKPKVFWRDRETFAGQLRLWTLPRLTRAQAALWQAEVRAKTAGAVADAVVTQAFGAVADLARG